MSKQVTIAENRFILTNGTIRTLDRRQPTIDELVIEEAVIRHKPSGDDPLCRVDLTGCCVLPGFTDAHTHFPTWAMISGWLNLVPCTSLPALLGLVASAAADRPPGGWVVGYGWRNGLLGSVRSLPRLLLDQVAGDVPTALWSQDMHTFWLNSKAAARVGTESELYGDTVELDEHGHPTGILREMAAWRFREAHLTPTLDHYADAVAEAIRVAHARGVTAVHDKDGWVGAPAIWARVRERGALSLRVWQSVPPEQIRSASDPGMGSTKGEFLRVGYVKVFVDGSLGSGTALMFDGTGALTTSSDDLVALIQEASAAGLAVAVHAIGDKANRIALDALEATRHIWHPLGLRQRIEHAQHLHASDIHRFVALGVACSVQFTDGVLSRDAVDALSPAVAEGSFAFRSLWDSGALLVNGSDAPLTPLHPMLGVQAGVVRTLDDRDPWQPHQALTVTEALEASTVLPAWLSREEDLRGRLVPGQLADLVVLSRDPLACEPRELASIEVVATMVGGRWVHNPPPWN